MRIGSKWFIMLLYCFFYNIFFSSVIWWMCRVISRRFVVEFHRTHIFLNVEGLLSLAPDLAVKIEVEATG